MKRFMRKLIASSFLICLTALPVAAQDADMQSLLDRLERMDRDIKSLNLKVYRSPSAQTTDSTGEDVNGPLGARLSVRINELESQLRQMTGQIEETAYRISQLNTRLDKLVADVDYRLTTLEGGNPSARPDLGSLSDLQGQPKVPQGMSGGKLAPPSQGQVTAKPMDTPKGVLGTLNGQDLKQPNPTQEVLDAKGGTPASDVASVTDLTPEALYQQSRQMLMRSEFSQAESSFKAFLEKHDDHKLASNVRYWLGETYYVQGDFPRAAATFLQGYQRDPRGAKAPDALLKLAMSLKRMDKQQEACATFVKLRSDFPQMPAHLSKTLERERSQAQCN